jgi:hypothetical protein
MKHLLEISKIVTKKKVKKIEIFDDHSLKQKNSKFNEFYELLMKGALNNDKEAAEKLYGSSPTDDKYRQLKSRFKKRILNTLFFLDINQASSSNYNRAYYSCHKDWTLVKILLSNKANGTATQLAKSILGTALKFEFSDIIVSVSRILRAHAMHEEDEKLYEEYSTLCEKYQLILTAEIESDELYERTIFNSKKSSLKAPDRIKLIQSYCDRLLNLSNTYSSPIILYNQFMVFATFHEMQEDYKSVSLVCASAEQYIIEHPHLYREDKLAKIALKKLLAFVHLQDFEEGQIQAEEYLKIFEKNDAWLQFYEYYLLLAIHCKEYIAAHAIFDRAYEDKRFRKISNASQDKWNAFETYLCLLLWVQTEEGLEKPRRYKQFKVKRFLEEPIIFPKNQRIFTVILVIAQVVFLLQEERSGEAFERVERLKGYSTRLLKQEEHYRITQFVRLLQQLAKAHFDYTKIGVYQKYLTRLIESPIKYRNSANELEIIPYHHLWEMILNSIDDESQFR